MKTNALFIAIALMSSAVAAPTLASDLSADREAQQAVSGSTARTSRAQNAPRSSSEGMKTDCARCGHSR
jgi:hypothetical protein